MSVSRPAARPTRPPPTGNAPIDASSPWATAATTRAGAVVGVVSSAPSAAIRVPALGTRPAQLGVRHRTRNGQGVQPGHHLQRRLRPGGAQRTDLGRHPQCALHHPAIDVRQPLGELQRRGQGRAQHVERDVGPGQRRRGPGTAQRRLGSHSIGGPAEDPVATQVVDRATGPLDGLRHGGHRREVRSGIGGGRLGGHGARR